MRKNTIENSQKKENKFEIKEEKEDINNENEVRENENIDINNKNYNEETVGVRQPSKNEQLDREGTQLNLLLNDAFPNDLNNEVGQYDEKKIDNKNEENQEDQVIGENEKLKENVDYSNLPKIKNGRVLTKTEMYIEDIKEQEDSCDKFPLRCLVFIPICCGYFFISLFDFLTYLIVPLAFCLFYTIIFIGNYCRNILSEYQVEEEIGFSGAFTSENEIKIHVADEGGVMHLNEILCFSYMSACVKRYFCFIFVLINHVLVPILQAWKKSKECFIKSRIEQEYDARMKNIEEAKKYKGFDQVETQIEINNN